MKPIKSDLHNFQSACCTQLLYDKTKKVIAGIYKDLFLQHECISFAFFLCTDDKKGAFTKKKNWNPSDVEIQFFENISWSNAFDKFFFIFIFNLGFIDSN